MVRTRACLLLLWSLCFAAGAAVPQAAAQELHWHHSYADAIAAAKQSGRPIFLEFRCAP